MAENDHTPRPKFPHTSPRKEDTLKPNKSREVGVSGVSGSVTTVGIEAVASADASRSLVSYVGPFNLATQPAFR